MAYYNYHANLRSRINSGELSGFYYSENYPRIGKCLVLQFKNYPFEKPVRMHSLWRYADIIGENYDDYKNADIPE